MVQYSTTVDRTFAALADPTRRAVVERLGSGSATISELAEPLGISLTGMKKHVQVLEDAQLVQTFQNHVQTLEFEDLGDRTKLVQTMRFDSSEDRDTTMGYGVEKGAEAGFARIDALLAKRGRRVTAEPRPRA